MDTEKLSQLEILYDEGVHRFAGHAPLYEKYLFQFPDDPTFARLKEAMEKGDYQEAFLQAHTLKGVTGNLSLAGLYQALIPFVELLREGGDPEKAADAFPALCEKYETLMAALRELRP